MICLRKKNIKNIKKIRGPVLKTEVVVTLRSWVVSCHRSCMICVTDLVLYEGLIDTILERHSNV